MTTRWACLGLVMSLLAVVGCRGGDCTELPPDRAHDAEAIVTAVENVRWQLEEVNGLPYYSHPGETRELVFRTRRVQGVSRHELVGHPGTCNGDDGVRPFETEDDLVRPIPVIKPVWLVACSGHRSTDDRVVASILSDAFILSLDGNNLVLRGKAGVLRYRSKYAASVRSTPLIGTWRISKGPAKLVQSRFRLRLTQDRGFHLRFDCSAAGGCGGGGTFGLGCDGERFQLRIESGFGPSPTWSQVAILNDARSLSVNGDELVISTRDDRLELARVDSARDLTNAKW